MSTKKQIPGQLNLLHAELSTPVGPEGMSKEEGNARLAAIHEQMRKRNAPRAHPLNQDRITGVFHDRRVE